jgi:hypothetical protein
VNSEPSLKSIFITAVFLRKILKFFWGFNQSWSNDE